MFSRINDLPDYKKTAFILACCGPGDTLLYIILPMFHDFFSVSLAEAGILLAANRIIRIFGYSYVVRLYNRFGDRLICQLSSIGTLCCCLGYIFLKGFALLLIIRILWGLSFAGLNLSTQATATSDRHLRSKIAGSSRSIISSGQMVLLPLCSIIIWSYGIKLAYLVLAIISLISFGLSFFVRTTKYQGFAKNKKFSIPSTISVWSFTEGVVIDGLFIFSLAAVFSYADNTHAVISACLIMASRYAFEVFFSPLGGHLAHRFGARNMLIGFSVVTCLFLILYGFEWIYIAPVAILILRAIQLPLVPVVVADSISDEHRITELASNAIWRDIGAGLGPLIAGISSQHVAQSTMLYLSALLLILATAALTFIKAPIDNR
ncbi:MFS transporter [Buttiauxella ferragutiae]|uniref:MFS transporter n=1 Tax=Buttiauxella ferragutiae TaxID=82989 RepID=UPI001E50FA72|nr:MFS transporter [Buttiauxella ferragutiae]MCE0828846.1 MFS transporter [Buttiauxella ferragutiae]